MKELIKIQEQNGNSVVSARELHTFLEVTERFNSWCNRMFEYGFTKDTDFTSVKTFTLVNNGAKKALDDYALTIDTAKEISMLQRSEKGKQARRYFIECEKQLKNKVLDLSDANVVLQLAQNFAEEQRKRIALEQKTALQSAELQKQAPKVAYHDEVLTSKSTHNTNKIAKELGMSAISLNRKLHELGIQYKQNGTWLLYHKHQNKGYTKTETYTYTNSSGETKTSMQTVWTEKGRQFVHSLLKKDVA